MDRRGSNPRRVAVLAAAFTLIAAACGAQSPSASAPAATATSAPSAVATPSPTPAPAITPAPIDTSAPGPNGGVVIRWFVGLGAGGQPQQFAAEQAYVDAFNASDAAKNKVFISLEIYNNNVAANILKTQIAAGNAPDIIGPVGVEGLNLFRDQLLDLKPLIESSSFDMSKYDPALRDFFNLGVDGATIGVPFATYPSFLWYNTALFKEAGLPLPPTKVGDKYDGKDWTMDTVRELAMKLTVDANGNDASSADFDATKVEQWGFDMQWADNSPLAEATLFGGGSFVASDARTAQIPDSMRVAEKWFNDGVWTDHFIPNANQINSDLLAKGNLFQSGNLAMDETHLWYSCCVNPAAPAKPIVTDFGWAIAPSYNGTITAKLHADTFSILNTTKHPEEAFLVLSTLATSGELLTAYGAFPADPSLQQTFIDNVNKQYPDVTLDWSVPQAMLAYPDIPNHQAWVPDYAKSKAAWQKFQNNYRTTAGVNIDAELDALKTTLQGIFDAAEG
jgi:multiple sugar transport system substrate-binding protein